MGAIKLELIAFFSILHIRMTLIWIISESYGWTNKKQPSYKEAMSIYGMFGFSNLHDF